VATSQCLLPIRHLAPISSGWTPATTTILRGLERAWEAGRFAAGRQAAEFNAALRALWQTVQRQPITRADTASLRLVHS
jgi:hypothetical protein